jgi:hypothetical protein
MLNALVHTMYSHYCDKRFIYWRDSPKYRGCSVVLSNFFNLILIKYLNHLKPVVSIGTIRQSQSHVFRDGTSCSLMSNYDIQTSMLLQFLWYTHCKTDCLAQWDRGSNSWHVYNFFTSRHGFALHKGWMFVITAMKISELARAPLASTLKEPNILPPKCIRWSSYDSPHKRRSSVGK